MTARQKALIIDDEPDIRELLEITLGRMKLDTRSARNLKEARELLAREHYDLCLTDMRLPDGSGLELVQYIQQQHPQLQHHVQQIGRTLGKLAAIGVERHKHPKCHMAVDDLRRAKPQQSDLIERSDQRVTAGKHHFKFGFTHRRIGVINVQIEPKIGARFG